MSQQNNQNLPPSNLPNAQPTADDASNTTDDQPPQTLQENRPRAQQLPQRTQSLSQAQGSALPQSNVAQQQSATPQIQPAPSPNVRSPSVALRGGAKKKVAAGNKKTTGVRPKPITTEKNDDMGLPQALSKMAEDFLNQANQYGKDTLEGQAAYKKYVDSMQALEQHKRNNQLGNFSFTPQQTTSPASTPSPHQMPRIISSTGPSPLASQQPRLLLNSDYNNIQSFQQLKSEMSRINSLLTQENLTPNSKTDLLNRMNTLNQLSIVKFGTSANAGPMQHMSPQSPYNSPRSYMGTQGNDYRMTAAPSQSPSSPLANSNSVSSSHAPDTSIITSPNLQQQQAMQQLQQYQQSLNNPQSP
ncbi:15375_t:CDS:2, partial [Acaulospora morrowiae]